MASDLLPFSLFFLILVCSWHNKVHGDDPGFEVLKLESLMPATVCTESEVPSGNAVKVIHRYGPCFLSGDSQPDHDQIFSQDSLRVAYLQNLTRLSSVTGNTSADALRESLQASIRLPARSGQIVGSPNYVVTINIGSRRTTQTMMFDTGSHICWVQCNPRPYGYPQWDPVFNPFTSSSYRNVTCNDPACTALHPEYRRCTNINTCVYRAVYGDASYSSGFLATEMLTLGDSNVQIPNFIFGCGQSNKGSFVGVAGLFGLGRGFHSLATQTAGRHGNIFSYCLPSRVGYTGYLVLGPSMAPSPSYTPMRPDRYVSSGLYYLDLIGISVGEHRLPISRSVFDSIGTIIDSGTVITHLPATAYGLLRDAFRSATSRYRLVRIIGNMDTCYNVGGGPAGFSHPPISLHYSGMDLRLVAEQTFYVVNATTFCLAFTSVGSGRVGIIGNIQQIGMEVIYDVGRQRIGFSKGTNCR